MPLTKVTDPSILAEVEAQLTDGNSAPTGRLKKVTDPSILAEVNAQLQPQSVKPKTKLLTPSEEESWLPDILKPVSQGLNLVRENLGGETIAKLPSLVAGDVERTGAQTSRELETERRGMLPEYRKTTGTARGLVQTAANAAADAVAMAGAEYSLPLELAVLAGRRHGQMAGGLATDAATAAYRAGLEAPAKAMFGEIAAKALARQQSQGDYATVKAAKEATGGTAEFIKGAAFGMSPALFETARTLTEGGSAGDAYDAGVEALKAYPLASVMPMWHGMKYAGERGGAPVVREGVPVQTITGKPIEVNKFGETMFEPVTKLAESAASRLPEQTVAAVGRGVGKVANVVEKSIGPKTAEKVRSVENAAKSIAPVVGDTVKDVLEWGKETVEPKWQRLTYDAVTPKDLTRQQGLTAANQILMTGESPASKNMKIALEQYNILRDIDTELADPRFKGATELEKFQAIEGTLGGTTHLMEAPVMDQNSRAVAEELGNLFVQHGMPLQLAQKAVPLTVLEGVRLAQQGKLQDPMMALHTSLAELSNKSPVEAQAAVKALGAIVQSKLKDPNFLAAADQAWSGKGYRWVPGAEVRQRNGFAEAVREAQKSAQEAGRPLFDLSVPELGELRKDYTFQLYDKLVDDLHSSPQTRAQLAQLLMSSPIARMAANPTSPAHIQALAAWHSQPGGARAKLGELLNQASMEAVQNYGIAPKTVLKHFDRYLSRAFTDAIAGQVKLSNYVSQMDADARIVGKVARQVDSGRFRRRMSEEQSNQRFVELVNNGDISLHDALASTVVSTMVMNNHLSNLAQMHDTWLQQGLLSDTPKPGFTKIPEVKAAPGKQAASPNPYNYAYGKLAGKYVDGELTAQLNLVPNAMRKAVETMPYVRAIQDLAGEVLGFTRFMKTTGNAIVYPIRNAVTDPLVPMAASGETPYSGWGRKANLEAKADIDRMVRTRQDPNGMVMSPDLREMVERGVLDVNKIPNDSSVPANMRPQVQAMVNKIEKIVEQASDPAERIQALAHAAMYARAMGNAGVKEMPLAALKAFRETLQDTKVAKAKGMPTTKRVLRTPAEFVGHLNDHLSEIAIAQVIAKMEMSRAVWAYKVARHKLNLDADRAAIFLRDTVYGIDKPSEMMSRISQSPFSLVAAPLFTNYGVWQGKRTVQRALSNPHVWTNYMITKGLDAMNEDDLLHDPFLENSWKDRLARTHVQHVAAADIGLGSVGGVQDAMRHMGVPETVVSKVGKPDNIIAQDLTNLIGGQTFLHQFKPEKQGLDFYTQFGVFGGMLSQIADEKLRDPDYRDQTGLMGGETRTPGTVGRELLKSMVYRAFPSSWLTPINPNDPHSAPLPIPFIGRAAGVTEKVAQAKLEGRPAYKNAYKEEINPIDMFSREFGSFAPNIIDNTSFQARLAKNLGFHVNQITQELRDQMRHQANPNLPLEEQKARKKEFALGAGNEINQLTKAYTWQNKYKSRDEALQATRKAAADYMKRKNAVRNKEKK